MQDIVEQAFIEVLKNYIKRENISQKDLADRLGWKTSDLSNYLTREKSIGKKRRAHIISKLGAEFASTVNEKVRDILSRNERFTDKLSEFITINYDGDLFLFSEIAGVDPYRIKDYLSGTTPKETDIEKMANVIGIKKEELYPIEIQTKKPEIKHVGKEAAETKELDIEIPVVGRAGATDDIGRTAFEPLHPPYETASFKGCRAVIIDSNSMAPVAYKGQKVIYSEIERVREGDLVYVGLKNGERLFKRYHNHDHITLQSINPVDFCGPIVVKKEDIEFCYKVVGVKF
ncbi:MAG: LexA family transcriptional regulator [Candidatus Jettenia caeni]|nr:MAG: LexA family transcriptional regulator [Candidatus Jettenia caeni]